MSSGGFDWPSGGRSGHDENGSYPDEYQGGSSLARRDDNDQDQGKPDFDWAGQLGPQSGYGPEGHGPDGYGAVYPGGGPYGDGYSQDAYGGQYPQDGYGQVGGYGHPGYGQDGYGQDGYGRDGYGAEAYGPGGYGQDPPGPGGYQNGYGRGGYGQYGYGQPGYGAEPSQDPYGQNGYSQASHDQNGHDQNGYGQNGYYGQGDGYGPQNHGRDVPDPYGQEGYGSTESYRQPGRHGRSGQSADTGQDATSAYQRPALHAGQEQDAADGYAAAPEAPAETGSFVGDNPGSLSDTGWFGGSDTASDTGSFGRPDTGSFGRPDTGSFGTPDTGSFGRPDTGSFGRPDTGSFSRPDTGSAGVGDTGSFGVPVTGTFSRVDTGSFGQPGTGSSGRPDTGSFGIPDTGTFNAPESYWANGHGADPDEDSPLGSLPASSRTGGYSQWQPGADDADSWDDQDHDDAGRHDDLDEDWPETGGADLLSRRFGVGGDGDDDDDGGGGRRGRRGRGGKPRRPRRVRSKVAVVAAVLAAALVLGAGADYGYQRYQSWHNGRYGDYSGTGFGKVHFVVPAGAVLSELGPNLLKAGVIKEVRPFDTAASSAAGASNLQPGVYLLHHHMSAADAVTYLLNVANRLKDQVTITEGLRASAIADLLAKQTHLPVSQFTQIIDNPPASLGLPSWAGGKTAEGFLFPDTYTLLPHESALDILKTMVSEFNTQMTKINLTGEARKVFTTPWHALIVASLIQAEAGRPSDFGKISRVTWNRLGKNMMLQYDSTVFYAMGTYGTAANSQQIKFKSPYNTYLHTGLPPGPIGNPGVAAMQAAVHPVKANYLYFITDTRKKPYITHFTGSYSTFQQWQREFQN
jgi:uncharacterized YceG family protein